MLAVANGGDFTQETVKHVTVKVLFLQECVQHKIILLGPIRTHQNTANIMTKLSAGLHAVSSRREYSLGELQPWYRGFACNPWRCYVLSCQHI